MVLLVGLLCSAQPTGGGTQQHAEVCPAWGVVPQVAFIRSG